MTPTGTEHIFVPSPSEAIRRAISWIYRLPRKLNRRLRDSIIRARHAAGETLTDLAREFGISPQRVWQIVQFSP